MTTKSTQKPIYHALDLIGCPMLPETNVVGGISTVLMVAWLMHTSYPNPLIHTDAYCFLGRDTYITILVNSILWLYVFGN